MTTPKKFVFNDPGITETPQMDFPQAFEFIKQNALDKNEHHPKCSYRQAGMLCDCSILWAEYYKRRVAALEAQVALLADPHAVHVNILRGTLPLTKAQAIHIAGLPVDIEAQVQTLRDALGRIQDIAAWESINPDHQLDQIADAAAAALAATEEK